MSIENIVERIFAPRNSNNGISKGVRFRINDLRFTILRSHAPTMITVNP